MADPLGVAELAKSKVAKRAYDDALSPMMQEIGKMGQDVLKTAHLIFAPLQYLAAQQDRFARWIEQIAHAVPEARRQSPSPEIVGPVVRQLAFLDYDNELADMYVKLLTTAMDVDRSHEAHPAFISIIEQLSPDEARILRYLGSGSTRHSRAIQCERNSAIKKRAIAAQIQCDELIASLNHPESLQLCLDHLLTMKLLAVEVRSGVGDEASDADHFDEVILNEWGWWFVKAVGRK